MKNLFVLSLLIFTCFSCSRDNITEDELLAKDRISIEYQGKTFSATIDQNGKIKEGNLDEVIKGALITKHIVSVDGANLFLFDTVEEADSYFNITEEVTTSNSKWEKNKNDVTMKAVPVGTSRSEFYYHANYGGSFHVTLNNSIYEPELRNRRQWHDKISSFNITNSTNNRFAVRLYEHAYFRGRTFTVITNSHTVSRIPNLANNNFNDITSGIRGWFY